MFHAHSLGGHTSSFYCLSGRLSIPRILWFRAVNLLGVRITNIQFRRQSAIFVQRNATVLQVIVAV